MNFLIFSIMLTVKLLQLFLPTSGYLINSMKPSDAIWHHKNQSLFVQVIDSWAIGMKHCNLDHIMELLCLDDLWYI